MTILEEKTCKAIISMAHDDIDYWTRLEHQYAGMAMQGLCANPQYPDKSWDAMATDAAIAAHALVEQLKSNN